MICKYDAGLVDSCFDCSCKICADAVRQYEMYLNQKAEEDEYNTILQMSGVRDD